MVGAQADADETDHSSAGHQSTRSGRVCGFTRNAPDCRGVRRQRAAVTGPTPSSPKPPGDDDRLDFLLCPSCCRRSHRMCEVAGYSRTSVVNPRRRAALLSKPRQLRSLNRSESAPRCLSSPDDPGGVISELFAPGCVRNGRSWIPTWRGIGSVGGDATDCGNAE